MSNTPRLISWIWSLSEAYRITMRKAIGLITSKRRKCTILDLPPELMDLIFPHLSIIFKACLAMSCKNFYHQFGYILKADYFRYPYSDGLDTSINTIIRGDFLKRLQSPELYFGSRRWRYCHACIKLHPGNYFDERHSVNFCEPSRAQCAWPGVIMLCPCLKISLKTLASIYNDVQTTEYLNFLGNVPHWHECRFESPCKRLSYTLAISVSILETRELIFDFEYLVYLNRVTPYQGNQRIMLCPHKEALKILMSSRYRNCRLKHFTKNPCIKHMQCDGCGVFPSVRISDDLTNYGIQLSRKYPAPGPRGYRRADFADYDWNRRYYSLTESHPPRYQIWLTYGFSYDGPRRCDLPYIDSFDPTWI